MERQNKFSKDELEYSIREFKNGKSCIEIGKELNRNPSTIRRNLTKVNVYHDKKNYISEEELNSLIEDYNNGYTLKCLSEKYNRSTGYIVNKLRSIGIYKDTRLNFTDEETDFMIQNYSVGNFDAIFNRFPNLSKSTLYDKMYRAGIRSGRKLLWNETELQFLEENYYTMDIKDIQKSLLNKRSKNAIESKALKFFGYSKNSSWTIEEEKVLIKNYSNIPLSDLCKIIPSRSKDAIIIHANSLGLKSYITLNTKWNKEQDDYLIANWELKSDDEIGCYLNKDRRSVKTRRNLLGLFRCRKDYKNYENISKLLRGQLWDWKNESMKNCNYECVLTHSKDFQIHHLYPFCRIIEDMFNNEEYDIPDKDYDDFTELDFLYVIKCFKKEHDKHPLGVCVRKDIHDLYHKLYGKYNNSPEQWNSFCENYKLEVYK